MYKLKQKLFIAILALIILNPSIAIAQTNSNISATTVRNSPVYQNVQQSVTQYLCTPSDPADGRDLERCVNKLYRFGIAFGAIALVFFLVFAGYMYMTAGETGKTKAKGILQNSFVGMGILLFSYVLLRFVNPNLVAFRPIQPPIFTAPDLPDCDEIGYEDDCTVFGSDGSATTVSGGGGGVKVPCPGKIVSAKGLGLPTKQADEQICEEFGKKLLTIKAKLAGQGIDWRVTDTIGSGHESKCHTSGNVFSGTCADVGLNDGASKTITEKWNKICIAIKEAGLYPHYEVNPASYAPQAPSCPPYKKERLATGPHIHVMWKK